MASPEFAVHDLPLLGGRVGICPIPGRGGDYPADLERLQRWRPDRVIGLTSDAERRRAGALTLPADLARAGVIYDQVVVTDFGAPDPAASERLVVLSAQVREELSRGGRVLAHCFGGCGRSGMTLLRIMVDAGEPAHPALMRLRRARPCAVETNAQLIWATDGVLDHLD